MPMGTAKCARNTVGSLVLGQPAAGGGFRLWPQMSVATLKRKLADALFCGVSLRRANEGRRRRRSRAPPPAPPSRAGSDRLSELLKEELSDLETTDEVEETEAAEKKRKVELLEELQRVVRRLQPTGEGGDWRCWEAASEVRTLAKGDADAREMLAMLGAIPPLVAMLDSSDDDDVALRVESLYALLNLAVGNDGNKAAIVSAGALPKMLKLIGPGRAPTPVAMAVAANFLGLSALDSNKPIIGAASGAVPFLAETFRDSEPPRAQGRQDALRALFNLSLAPSNLPRLVAAGLVPDLLDAVGDMGTTERALAVLANVVSTAEGRGAVGRTPGAFSVLVDVLGWTDAPGCQEEAAYVLMVMAHRGRSADREAMSAAGAVSSLLELALMGTALAQRRASRTLESLGVETDRKGKQAMEKAAAPAVSAPQGAAGRGERPEEEDAWMGEGRRAVRRLVLQSLQCNMSRIARRANLAPPSNIRPLVGGGGGTASKSLPF